MNRPIRIGVDARELLGSTTGVGRYLGELLRRWTTRADAANAADARSSRVGRNARDRPRPRDVVGTDTSAPCHSGRYARRVLCAGLHGPDCAGRTARGDDSRHFVRRAPGMVQAARSGRQNIAEGSQASGTSKKTELKLVGVARASLEELLLDYEDFIRQRGLVLWSKAHSMTREIRQLAYLENRTYQTYRTYIEDQSAEVAANTIICLIHQTNYLLDQQLRQLEKAFLKEGGFTERLYWARKGNRE